MGKTPQGVPDFSARESIERYQEVTDRESIKNGSKKVTSKTSGERYRSNYDKIVWDDLDAKEDKDDSSEVSKDKSESDNS